MSEKVELLFENCSLLFAGRPGEEEDLLRDQSVAIADGKIIDFGDRAELSGRYSATTKAPLAGRLLTPGLVDSHTHLVFAGNRSQEFVRRCQGASYEEIAAAGGGIRASVRATRQASEEELFQSALPRVLRMLAFGTTTIEVKSGYGLDLESELRMLRVVRRLNEETPARLVPTFLGAHEVPDEYQNDRDGFVDLVCETMTPRVAEEGLAVFADVFCEAGVFTPEQSKRVLEAGRRHGLAPKIHADELAASGGSETAAEVDAISADHLMKITDEGIRGLKERGVVATLLPGTTFYLGKDSYAPARRLLDAGLTVALATDRNPGSCTIESLPFIIGISCLYMGMTPIEAFRGATENGAQALNLEESRGRIARGYDADVVVWDVQSPDELIYEFNNVTPREVFVGGRSVSGWTTPGPLTAASGALCGSQK